MRLLFGNVKTALARVLGMNPTDARVAEYVSRAQEILLHKGKWVDTYGRYRVCVNDSCLTWPREIETIEAAALCNVPMTVRSGWYEFLNSGPGVIAADCGPGLTLVDRGDAVAFDDVTGTGKKLAVYCDGNEASGAQILLRYYDSNGNKVYSTVSGQSVEGEYLTLPAAGGYVYSTYEVMPGGFYGVVKPATLRQVRVYQYTVSGGALKPLAYYEPDETNPVYRRSLIPGLSCACATSEDACGTTTVDVVGKFRHRPVAKDSDALIIGSLEALRLMCQALRKQEDNLWDDAAKYEARAEAVLGEQLRHWLGDGKVQPLRVQGAATWGGGVCNMQ